MATNNSINKKPDTNRTQHTIGVYGASGALSELGPLTNGQLATGNTGNAPTAASLTSIGSTVTVTPGAGAIDLSIARKFGDSGFQAYNSANRLTVTGNNTVYTIAFDTEIFDIGGDYNNGTYTFTAPNTGKYYFSCMCYTSNIGSSHTYQILNINTSNRDYNVSSQNPYLAQYGSGFIINGCTMTDMDAADTCSCYVRVTNGTKTITVGAGGRITNFSGWEMT